MIANGVFSAHPLRPTQFFHLERQRRTGNVPGSLRLHYQVTFFVGHIPYDHITYPASLPGRTRETNTACQHDLVSRFRIPPFLKWLDHSQSNYFYKVNSIDPLVLSGTHCRHPTYFLYCPGCPQTAGYNPAIPTG